MNVLVLNYEYPPIGGGAAPAARDAAEELAKRGHKITVVTMGYKGLPNHETVYVSNADKEAKVEIYRIPCWRSKAAICHPWEQLTYIIAAKRFLKKHINENNYDVCHTHFIIPTGVISEWLKKRYHIPYVITSHGSDVQGYNKQRFKFLHKVLRSSWRKITANAEALHIPSEYLSKLVLRANPGLESKIAIIPYGIDIDIYQTGPKENIVLAMSRLQQHKGVQDVISAFAKIVNEVEEKWYLHIAGDGPYRPALETLVREKGIQDYVVFHGWLQNKSKEHIDLLAKARIFVSASDFENMPVSVIEAVASECQVLLSDIEAHMFYAEFCSSYFPLRDIDMLSAQLKEAITTPQSNEADKSKLSQARNIDKLEQVLNLRSEL